MIAVLTLGALAAAAPKPDHVDLDDVDHYEQVSWDVLKGPPGCWELSGDLTVRMALMVAPSLDTLGGPVEFQLVGPFSGTLDGGTWTAFKYELEARIDGETEEFPVQWTVVPMVGRIDQRVVEAVGADEKTRDDDPLVLSASPLQAIIDEVDPATSTTLTQWEQDPDGVRTFVDVPLDDSRRPDLLEVRTFVPGDGAVPTHLDATFPERMKLGKWPARLRLYATQMHLRTQEVDGTALPAVESLSTVVGVMGFTLGFEQHLDYRSGRRCTPAPAAPVASDGVDPILQRPG